MAFPPQKKKFGHVATDIQALIHVAFMLILDWSTLNILHGNDYNDTFVNGLSHTKYFIQFYIA